MGTDRTYFHVRSKGWWPGYRADITDWVKSCHHCQLVKPGPGRGKQRLKQERVGAPCERVAIDLIGPLPSSNRGKKYLVVMQDCFTKWVEVEAIATKKTTVVAEAFVRAWVTRHGCPRVLHQDNGLEFTGDVFVEVCSILGVARTTTTPYFPQSNGQVERINQTLQNMLKCVCFDTGRDWAVVADWVASAYRVSQQESTGQTPNKLVFGDELAQPLDLIYGKNHGVTSCTTEYAQKLQSIIKYAHTEARKHLNVKLRAHKLYYDRML
jgi:hypothetical protein